MEPKSAISCCVSGAAASRRRCGGEASSASAESSLRRDPASAPALGARSTAVHTVSPGAHPPRRGEFPRRRCREAWRPPRSGRATTPWSLARVATCMAASAGRAASTSLSLSPGRAATRSAGLSPRGARAPQRTRGSKAGTLESKRHACTRREGDVEQTMRPAEFARRPVCPQQPQRGRCGHR